LIEALESIFNYEQGKLLFEICISNNASNQSYAEVETLLEKNRNDWDIKYIVQDERLEIDPHMHFVVNMATSDYCYLLGDDDFFINEDLLKLVELVQKDKPDLAVFSGVPVNTEGSCISKSNKITSQKYTDAFDAFKSLRARCPYGAILVGRKYVQHERFIKYYGSSHAYSYSFWIELLNASADNVLIVVPDFHLVCLRAGEKTYSALTVYYKDIIFGACLYERYLLHPKHRLFNGAFKSKVLKKNVSLPFVLNLVHSGHVYNDFYQENPFLVKKIRFKLSYFLSKLICEIGAYSVLKKLKRSF
jgi:abequosyltransferase